MSKLRFLGTPVSPCKPLKRYAETPILVGGIVLAWSERGCGEATGGLSGVS